MAKFYVTLSELLARGIEVEAESEEEAHKVISRMYRHGIIVLNADDYVRYEIEVMELDEFDD